MKIFIDEDTGSGLAIAILALDLADYVDYAGSGKRRRIKYGTPDELWLPYVGQNGFLLLSCNTGILESEAQRGILREERVGAIFLHGQATKADLMRLILNRWTWIKTVDETITRPFAYILPMKGRARRDPRV